MTWGWNRDIPSGPVGDRQRRAGGDGGRVAPPRPRARRLLGALRGQGRPGRRDAPRRAMPIGVTATTTSTRCSALEADCVVYSPIFADAAVVTRILESQKNVVTPLGWFYPPARRARADRRGLPRGWGHPPWHRHPPRRDHRTVPADGLGALELDHPGAGRGVLRHPHLRRTRRHPRLDAVRQDAGGVADERHGRGARCRVPSIGAHGGRRARLRLDPELRTTHEMAVAPSRSSRPSARSDPASSRPSGSAGRASSTASR